MKENTDIQDQENELLEEAKEGNDEAVNSLFEKYRNFVLIKARNYFLMGAEQEDLIQEGMIGLLKAIRSYNKDRLTSFKTFASVCIKRQLFSAIKTANSSKNLALNNSIEVLETKTRERIYSENRKLSSYVSYTPEEIVISKEQMQELQEYLKDNLSQFEYRVFLKLAAGYSYIDIAKRLEKSEKAIDNAIQRIKKKSELWLITR